MKMGAGNRGVNDTRGATQGGAASIALEGSVSETLPLRPSRPADPVAAITM